MSIVTTFALTSASLLAMLGVWLLVQRTWGAAFGVDGDVLALRGDCGDCGHADDCLASDLCRHAPTTDSIRPIPNNEVRPHATG